MSSLVQYPTNTTEISQYLCALWKKEYAEQGISLITNHLWEHKVVPLASLQCQLPSKPGKARRYYRLVQQGIVVLPPLVCINGKVIDGLHRYWAYKKSGFHVVRIYQNIPWTKSVCA